LPFVFPLLFGEGHDLAGRNQNAFIDALQLGLMTNLVVDLCKPPKEQVNWNSSEAGHSWTSQKRLAIHPAPIRYDLHDTKLCISFAMLRSHLLLSQVTSRTILFLWCAEMPHLLSK
jgi:hypothetical protein